MCVKHAKHLFQLQLSRYILDVQYHFKNWHQRELVYNLHNNVLAINTSVAV